MRCILLFLCLIVGALPAAAETRSNSTSGPNAESVPMRQASTSDTAAAAENCPDRPPLAQGAPSSVVVQLDPDTLWRPRGAEVRFTISSASGGPIGVTKVRVCFGWSSSDGDFRNAQTLRGSPQVRSVSNSSGAIMYGAVVPWLQRIPNSEFWPARIVSSTPYIFTGAFTVPVADMVVEVTTASGPIVVSATQVGITEVIVAWVVVAVVLALVWLILDGVARYRGIYVMTLSGNLISISDGTLILLGIASAAALAARIPVAGQPPPQPVSDAKVTPEWSDLFIPDRNTREIDVTRLQMLAFTLITAAFMLIKVIVDYEIPTIPPNFLVLMGISNGVYVGGRRLPSQ